MFQENYRLLMCKASNESYRPRIKGTTVREVAVMESRHKTTRVVQAYHHLRFPLICDTKTGKNEKSEIRHSLKSVKAVRWIGYARQR